MSNTTKGRWIAATREMFEAIDQGELTPLDESVDDNGTAWVWAPAHDLPFGSGRCRDCGLVPLDWDALETPCR